MASGDLDCAVILLRAITRNSDFDKATRQLKPQAFHRRNSDKKGVSVDYNCPLADCGAMLRDRKGIATLHAGRVQSLGLQVVPDTANHANIIGVPMRGEDLEENRKAEQIAADLAEQARLKLAGEF
jgi:hypothetical protein